jgi:hypothetical protein
LKRRFCRGDYAIARRGAILVENASDLLFQARNKTDYCRIQPFLHSFVVCVIFND